ncbi:helix-turn-helix domain-containing protein [Streptomyces yanii]|uniref:helix-turn-helix domain-containing protein n=1 Tax=Streptomyces yanii TaxID=78510 RepID=UPI0031ECC155
MHAARGRSTARIARETGLHLDTVRTWRGRFAENRLPALSEPQALRASRLLHAPLQTAPGQGPWPANCPPRAALRSRAGRPRSWPARSSLAPSPARSLASTVRRWLKQDALKPWQYQSWIFITDPAFRPQGRARPRPLCPHLERRSARRGRVRDQRG